MRRRVMKDTIKALNAMGIRTRGIKSIMEVNVRDTRYSVYLKLGNDKQLYIATATLNKSANRFTGTPDSYYDGVRIFGLDVDETNDMINKALNIKTLINKI